MRVGGALDGVEVVVVIKGHEFVLVDGDGAIEEPGLNAGLVFRDADDAAVDVRAGQVPEGSVDVVGFEDLVGPPGPEGGDVQFVHGVYGCRAVMRWVVAYQGVLDAAVNECAQNDDQPGGEIGLVLVEGADPRGA